MLEKESLMSRYVSVEKLKELTRLSWIGSILGDDPSGHFVCWSDIQKLIEDGLPPIPAIVSTAVKGVVAGSRETAIYPLETED